MPSPLARAQLAALAGLTQALDAAAIDHWLFGGWAVDFHLGQISRAHADLDLAVWAADAEAVAAPLAATGWSHRPDPAEDGYTVYVQGSVSLDLAFLIRDSGGRIYTPVRTGRADWPEAAFGDEGGTLEGIPVRLIGRTALIAEKSEPRDDPTTAAKDRADLALLTGHGRPGPSRRPTLPGQQKAATPAGSGSSLGRGVAAG